jgi:hypothetical protein
MGSASAQINTDAAFEPGSIPGIVIYIFTTGKGLAIITNDYRIEYEIEHLSLHV